MARRYAVKDSLLRTIPSINERFVVSGILRKSQWHAESEYVAYVTLMQRGSFRSSVIMYEPEPTKQSGISDADRRTYIGVGVAIVIITIVMLVVLF